MDTSLGRDPDDDVIGQPFDQTNGLAGDLDGDSDGTAASDAASAADRENDPAHEGILHRLRDEQGFERGGGDPADPRDKR